MARRKNKTNSDQLWRMIPAKYRWVALLLIAVFLVFKVCSKEHTNELNGPVVHPDYGADATALTKVRVQSQHSFPEQLLEYAGMTVSFNPQWHTPNWVAWELTADETEGIENRSNKFVTDPAVAACATTNDYRNSGYDRGHMAPAGDMKWSREAMDETFYLTNICPQDKKLNTGTWKKIEEKCRQWARRDSAVVIVCGPVVADGYTHTIGETGVAVPKRFFKVVLAPYANPPRAIGFLVDNAANTSGMQTLVTSVDEVERVTGLDFFYELPDDVENAVEADADFNKWEKNH